jgi:soluble cytochrome b562
MMKKSLLSIVSVLSITTLLTFSGTIRADDDEPKTPLGEQMAGISKDFRSLRKVVSNPAQKDAALQLVKDMEARATKAQGLEPAKTKTIPAANKDQFIAAYKKQMDVLIGDFQKLEAAVTSGDTKGATALLDKLQADKRDGHKKFNAEADKGKRTAAVQSGPNGVTQ